MLLQTAARSCRELASTMAPLSSREHPNSLLHLWGLYFTTRHTRTRLGLPLPSSYSRTNSLEGTTSLGRIHLLRIHLNPQVIQKAPVARQSLREWIELSGNAVARETIFLDCRSTLLAERGCDFQIDGNTICCYLVGGSSLRKPALWIVEYDCVRNVAFDGARKPGVLPHIRHFGATLMPLTCH